MNELERKLNQKTHYFFGPEITGLTPLTVTSNSVTVVNDEEDAFSLQPSNGNIVVFKSIETSLPNAALWRGIVGYGGALKMSENDQTFIFVMSNLINEALKDLTSRIGNLDSRTIYLERPGMPKQYFKSSENSAGLELRIYVKKKVV